jgi:regulator of sigma E protease
VLAFVFVLGVLVFVHELGHFLAAKRVGIRVLKFQLGFNPTIVSVRRGDTEYGIGALPLGGYVKMAGENPGEARPEGAVPDPGEFLSKTKWQRFQVLVMGPVMNLLLAFVLTAIVLYQGAEIGAYEDQPPVVGVVTAGSPAAEAGIEAGDRILAVAGRDVGTWEQLFLAVGSRPNRETSIRFLREGREITRVLTPAPAGGQTRFEIGDIGVLPDVHPSLIAVNPGEPGERAGLRIGDVVMAVNDEPITFSGQLKEVISRHPEEPITISILRDGSPQTVAVTPMRSGDTGLIGVTIGDATKLIKPTAIQAVTMSVQRNVEMSGLIFRTVADLLTRQTSPKQLLGPVAIAQLSGERARMGWVALFALMATISLNLGLLNLLPIPVLDGGHILIMALEGIARRDFAVQVKERMLLAGLVVLVMLMVTVIYNDVMRIAWIERLVPWR